MTAAPTSEILRPMAGPVEPAQATRHGVGVADVSLDPSGFWGRRQTVNAAATLGGRPVASLRVSGADPRPRHQGISHHSLTAYGRVALLRADVPVPGFGQVADSFAETDHDPRALEARVREQALTLASTTARHTLVDVEATQALADTLEGSPVRLSTMGRGTAQDPAAFLAAAVAGQHAVSLLA